MPPVSPIAAEQVHSREYQLKIVTVIGARPQFVKAAAVSREIAKHADIREVIVHTGQHFDANMSDIFFKEMQIPRPDYHLEINSVGHGAMTGRMLEKIEEVLLQEKPDFVMVYGDTNSTLAGALAAKKLHVRVVHVEAGLRSFNMSMPEEVNRILTDRISDILCCPTENAVANLKAEGYDRFPCTVVNTGDVMQDAALFYSRMSSERSDIIAASGLSGRDYVLCTVHRAENTDDESRLRAIFEALLEIAVELPVVLPLHPRTGKIIRQALPDLEQEIGRKLSILPPVGYFDMIELIRHSRVVMTDSGGLQKEAYFFRKPCITLRDETEWVELVDQGCNRLVGASRAAILQEFSETKGRISEFAAAIYGEGNASARIIDALRAV